MPFTFLIFVTTVHAWTRTKFIFLVFTLYLLSLTGAFIMLKPHVVLHYVILCDGSLILVDDSFTLVLMSSQAMTSSNQLQGKFNLLPPLFTPTNSSSTLLSSSIHLEYGAVDHYGDVQCPH